MPKVKIGDMEYYLDGNAKAIMDIAKKKIRDDWDMFFIVDGYVGTGKSTFAMALAKYCDESFNIDRVCFTTDDFISKIIHAEKYQAIVFDEAYTGQNARESMSKKNIRLSNVFAEMRQKNLFIFLCCPSVFNLDKQAIYRSIGLFHVYTGNDFERGYFTFFNRDNQKLLYLSGKKIESYKHPRTNVYGRFVNYYVIDEDAYRRKKFSALKMRESVQIKKELEKEADRLLLKRLNDFDPDNEKINHELKMQILGISRGTYFSRLKELRGKADVTEQ